MTELKTLKDLNREVISDGFIADHIDPDELKEEAIKWYHKSDGNKHKFIKKFFNIDESDLK